MFHLVFAGLLVLSEPSEVMGENGPLLKDGQLTSIVIENDLFGGTDHNYSNGLRIEHVRPASQANPWLRRAARTQPFVDLDGFEIRDGFALSHTLYTPDDITLADPPANAHPYAAHLSMQFFATAAELDDDLAISSENTILIDIGLIGPSAGGEFIQSEWHQLIDGEEPLGWDTQLHDELVFAISGQRVDRHKGPKWGAIETDAVRHLGLNLGTLRTDLSTSLTLRAGLDLDADLAPPRLRPSVSPASLYRPSRDMGGYVFIGLGGYGVTHNVFLDGNTYRNSRSVDKNHFVGDIQAGLAMTIYGHRLAFTYVVRSEEFEGQNGPQRFGAISLSRAF